MSSYPRVRPQAGGPLRRVAAVLAALALVLPLAACSQDEEQTVTVLAAASLTETFTTLAQQFEDEHPGVTVKLAFDSSATLAQQVIEGAPADVLATADQATMDSAEAALAGEPRVFATNTMVLVTPPDNPAGISGLADLADTQWVECVPTAPCGKVAAAILDDAGITAEPVSLEPDVKAVLGKVTEGEADAGLVYATDAKAAGADVATVQIPGAEDHVTTYPIATVDQSGDVDLAQAFVDLVLSAEGSQVLADAGFGPPSP